MTFRLARTADAGIAYARDSAYLLSVRPTLTPFTQVMSESWTGPSDSRMDCRTSAESSMNDVRYHANPSIPVVPGRFPEPGCGNRRPSVVGQIGGCPYRSATKQPGVDRRDRA